MTRHRNSTLAAIALAGLLFVGAGCSSSDDSATGTDHGDKSAQTSEGGSASSISAGDLPDGWPAEIEMPPDTQVVEHETLVDHGKPILKLSTIVSDNTEKQVFDWISANTEDGGWVMSEPLEGDSPDERNSFVASKDQRSLVVYVHQFHENVYVTYKVQSTG